MNMRGRREINKVIKLGNETEWNKREMVNCIKKEGIENQKKN